MLALGSDELLLALVADEVLLEDWVDIEAWSTGNSYD